MVIKLPHVVIITGTPGVGKTVVSRTLTKILGAQYISLAEYVKKENLILNADSKRETIVADINKLSERINKIIIESTIDVIVEGHYAPSVVSSDLVSYVFVLRMDPDKLRQRLQERAYKVHKVFENVASEILDVCLFYAVKSFGVKKVDEIDVTDKTVDEIVKEIVNVLNGRKKAKVGKVDWLNKIEQTGRFDEFLTYLNWL